MQKQMVDTVNKSELINKGLLLPLMEAFYTIQGEGYHSGKAAYFIRIGGCDVGCHWCDVKESWNASLHPLTKTDDIVRSSVKNTSKAVVVTGGEPSMYNLNYLTQELRKIGIQTFVETSGAYLLSGEWNWICLSPKKTLPSLPAIFRRANELKIIVHNKDDFKWAEKNAESVGSSCILYLQPEWSKRNEMMPMIVDYVMNNPRWKVSLQTHKYLGIP
jgi:7-carboxy-7-deazaguanine synthase